MAYSRTNTLAKPGIDIDQGLRQHMLGVYNSMGIGLALSGVIAYMVGTIPALTAIFMGGPQAYLFIFAPVVMALAFGFAIDRISAAAARALYYAYAALMGISLSTIFISYQLGSIFQVFFITAAMFGATSLYGYTTNRDLTSLGSFLFMGVIGLVIASIVNIFLQNSMFQMIIAGLGVIIFTGLTAYDTQRIREIYYLTEGESRHKAATLGALALYMDFINLMISLIQLLGNRK